MSRIAPITRLFAAIAVAAALAGCATPAHQGNMAAAPVASTKKFPHSVNVETRGGSATGPMDSSNVSNEDLKAAIEASITTSGLFKSVLPTKNADYELSVTVAALDKPVFGGAFTVTLDTGWNLVRKSDGAVVLRKAVRSAHTVQMSEAFVGATRLRLALEGAVRKNISEGLQAIAELPL